MRFIAQFFLVLCLVLVFVSAHAQEEADDPENEIVREEIKVRVDGKNEVWQLVWNGKPASVCGSDDVSTATGCTCSGWAYGETGELNLVRKRGDKEIGRLELSPLFDKFEYPNGEDHDGMAYLSRWPIKKDDAKREERDDPDLLTEIEHRPATKIMELGDYNHDGSAKEFLLQVGTLPCDKHQYAAVGVSKASSKLHVLHTEAKPNDPLILPISAWKALEKGGSHTITTWACGDHGSDSQVELALSANNGKISVKEREYACAAGKRGKLLNETDR